MPLYFAYGANMDVAAMATRCPSSKPLGLARLPRHRWIISTDGYANVIRDPRREVHGMLWELALSDVPVLDRFEDVPRLYRKVTQPVISAKGIRQALIYVGRASEEGRPRPGYLDDVLRAAEGAGLPSAYIAGLRKFGEMRPGIAAPATAAKAQKWIWTP
ncbi:MAG: gamma-glutamylcyclotransferase family protein [Beijerinckiaceae bacterium]